MNFLAPAFRLPSLATAVPFLVLLGANFAAIAAEIPAPLSAVRANPARTIWDGVYTSSQAKRGAGLYASTCASCHGASLKEDEGAPPLAGNAFLAQWDGQHASDLLERMRATMPPDAPRTMGAQEYADILAYILSVNGMPAGKAELAARNDSLRQIRIESRGLR